MSHLDDVLELLDHATQRSPEHGYPTDPGDPEMCWRCLSAPGEGSAGVCANCRAFLLGEIYEEGGRTRVEHHGPGTLSINGVSMAVQSWTFVQPLYDDSAWETVDPDATIIWPSSPFA